MAKELVAFDSNQGKIWINPDHVRSIRPWNERQTIVVFGREESWTVDERPEEVARRINSALSADQ